MKIEVKGMKSNFTNKKFNILLTVVIVMLFVTSSLSNLFNRNYVNFATAAATLVIIFLIPAAVSKLHIRFPQNIWMIMIIYVFSANYLGTINSFYDRFWWWDIVLHALSGVIIGTIGYLLIFVINRKFDKDIKLTPAMAAIFTFSFSLSLGSVWEIYEFLMDHIFGLFMQKGSLVDTMLDIIADAAGALISSLLAFRHEKYRKGKALKELVEEFIELNR